MTPFQCSSLERNCFKTTTFSVLASLTSLKNESFFLIRIVLFSRNYIPRNLWVGSTESPYSGLGTVFQKSYHPWFLSLCPFPAFFPVHSLLFSYIFNLKFISICMKSIKMYMYIKYYMIFQYIYIWSNV